MSFPVLLEDLKQMLHIAAMDSFSSSSGALKKLVAAGFSDLGQRADNSSAVLGAVLILFSYVSSHPGGDGASSLHTLPYSPVRFTVGFN